MPDTKCNQRKGGNLLAKAAKKKTPKFIVYLSEDEALIALPGEEKDLFTRLDGGPRTKSLYKRQVIFEEAFGIKLTWGENFRPSHKAGKKRNKKGG